jgi:hypothetical protein
MSAPTRSNEPITIERVYEYSYQRCVDALVLLLTRRAEKSETAGDEPADAANGEAPDRPSGASAEEDGREFFHASHQA